MFTPDESGKIWHRGTRIGLCYAVVLVIVLALLGSIDDETPKLKWLKKFDFVAFFIPIAAGSQSYVAGKRAAKSGTPQ